MALHTDKQLVLCDVCEIFRDVDKLVSRQMLEHHKSYTALCRAASNGCSLCQAFLRAQSLTDRPDLLQPNFDEDMDAGKTQITLRQHSDDCIFMLSQEALLRTGFCFNVWVEFYTEGGDPLASILSGRPIQMNANSDACFDIVSCWIEKCRTEHRLCPRNEDLALPSRVLDVGSNSRDPFLHITKGQRGQWITLSHCWGNDVPIKTTKDTIRQRETSIPLMQLPPTFRDAILITRKLGFQYLWIDSLCIIQDSFEDWALESTQMYQTYSGASMNISASAGRSSQDGIFSSADRDRCHTGPLISIPSYSNRLKAGGSLSIRLQSNHSPSMTVTEQPLHRRAWVLQESTLSPRRIEFSSDQLYWRCRTSCLQEGDPYVPSGPFWFDLCQIPLEVGDTQPQPDIEEADESPISWWYKILRVYSDRRLTFAEDTLPAIAGIAHKVKEMTGYNYKAGLWLEDIHRSLLWQANDSIERLENTSAPSWSWASAKLPWTPRALFLHNYLPGFRATVIEVSINNLECDPLEPVNSGSLMVEGGCRAFENWYTGKTIIYNTSPCKMRQSNRWVSPGLYDTNIYSWLTVPPHGRIICTLDESRPKRKRELKDGTNENDENDENNIHSELIQRKVICLQIAKFGHDISMDRNETDEEIATIFGLVLEPTGLGADEYRRIGIAEIPEENGMAEDWNRRRVTVV